MEQLVRVGALARIDPDPAEELATWEADLAVGRIDDPAETRRRLDAYARGDQFIVRLEVFAEILGADGVSRYDGTHVRGAWFERGERKANIAHARELVAGRLDDFHRELSADHGISVSYEDLAEWPLVIDFDDEVARRVECPLRREPRRSGAHAGRGGGIRAARDRY